MRTQLTQALQLDASEAMSVSVHSLLGRVSLLSNFYPRTAMPSLIYVFKSYLLSIVCLECLRGLYIVNNTLVKF